jgi:hypothetical protein
VGGPLEDVVVIATRGRADSQLEAASDGPWVLPQGYQRLSGLVK